MTTTMIIAGFIAGLMGSGHCITMCGPIVSLMEAPTNSALSPVLRRVLYQLGRLLCYSLVGLILVLVSRSIVSLAGIESAGKILRIVAALLLAMLGVRLLLGLDGFKFLDALGHRLWRKVSPAARFVLPIDRPLKAFGAGFLWGLLPCGMVYAAAAIAAVTGSAVHAVLVMWAFWLGTLPSLLAAGFSAEYLLQQRWRRVAGAVIIVFACVSVATLLPSHPHAKHDDQTLQKVHLIKPHR